MFYEEFNILFIEPGLGIERKGIMKNKFHIPSTEMSMKNVTSGQVCNQATCSQGE